MKTKLNYIIAGHALCLINIGLATTRFNIIGIMCGIASVVFLIKALRIKDSK